jgi:hypothetical protein
MLIPSSAWTAASFGSVRHMLALDDKMADQITRRLRSDRVRDLTAWLRCGATSINR